MAEVDNKSLDHLYAWIDTIPLTRPKKSIARDFADGVLVAEVVAHFFPKIVELHNYCNASSNTQKRINWQTLNRRVFTKMGMRIGEDTITHLIDAKQGIIEQVLWDIRSKIEQLLGSAEGKLNSNRRIKSATGSSQLQNSQQGQLSQQSLSVQLNRGNSLTAYPPPQTILASNEPQLTYRVAASESNSGKPRTSNKHALDSLDSPPRGISGSRTGSGPISNALSSPPGADYSGSHQTQGYVAPPLSDTSLSAHGPVLLSPIVDKNDNVNAGGPPAQIIYRGHKMIPLQFLDDKEKEIKALETSNRSLTLKIHRLETLVNVKDQRIEDLTHQLQNLRSMYERVTESSYSSVVS